MSFIKFNPNPHDNQTGDCVVRAISIAEGKSWDDIYEELTTEAYHKKSMPSMNPLWTEYLEDRGYSLIGVGDRTVYEFAKDFRTGTWVLGTGSHAIAVIDGAYIDTWDSGGELVMYALKKGEQNNVESTTIQQSTASATSTTDTVQSDNTINSTTATQSQPATISGSVLGAGIGGSQGLPDDNS